MKNERIKILDTIRGISIIAMIVHHIMFDLEFMLDVNIPLFHGVLMDILQFVFIFLFITISGICCNFSKSNIKRGLMVFAFGMVITLVTYFFDRDLTVRFGILHFLGIAMILYGLLEKVISKINYKIWLIIFPILYTLSDMILRKVNPVEIGFLFPLGFYDKYFSSGDYFPLLPYIFMFFFGGAVGYFIKKGNFPKWFYNFNIPFFSFVGKYTLWVYLIHQPVLYGIMYVISLI